MVLWMVNSGSDRWTSARKTSSPPPPPPPPPPSVTWKAATGDDGAVSWTTYWIVLLCFVLFSVANIIVTYVCALLKPTTRGVCDSYCNCTPIVVNKIYLKQTPILYCFRVVIQLSRIYAASQPLKPNWTVSGKQFYWMLQAYETMLCWTKPSLCVNYELQLGGIPSITCVEYPRNKSHVFV